MLLVKKVERELKGEIPVTTKISLADAVKNWLKHREQEGIGNDRAKNMSDRLMAFCKERQIVSLAAITKTHLMNSNSGLICGVVTATVCGSPSPFSADCSVGPLKRLAT